MPVGQTRASPLSAAKEQIAKLYGERSDRITWKASVLVVASERRKATVSTNGVNWQPVDTGALSAGEAPPTRPRQEATDALASCQRVEGRIDTRRDDRESARVRSPSTLLTRHQGSATRRAAVRFLPVVCDRWSPGAVGSPIAAAAAAEAGRGRCSRPPLPTGSLPSLSSQS
uniref:Uncharacterized protein n=1 Tax=Trichuris muris TaxID=70415 RepID=A0A5S6QDK7_TRIMR